jgi:hypothetical protein
MIPKYLETCLMWEGFTPEAAFNALNDEEI